MCTSVNRLYIKMLIKSILVLKESKIDWHTVLINKNSLSYSLVCAHVYVCTYKMLVFVVDKYLDMYSLCMCFMYMCIILYVLH